MKTNTDFLADDGLSNFIGWKSYNKIKKKAMEQEFSWSGLFLSLSIAFFIVLASALIMNVFHQSIEAARQHEYFLNQKIYRLEDSKHLLNGEASSSLRRMHGVKDRLAIEINYQGRIVARANYLDLATRGEKKDKAEIKNEVIKRKKLINDTLRC